MVGAGLGWWRRTCGHRRDEAGERGFRDAPDHNTAEHALWVGRPLLGQWVFDVLCLLDWLALQPTLDRRRILVAGIGQAGLVALVAAALLDSRVAGAMAIGTTAAYAPEEAYRSRHAHGIADARDRALD